jgi:hypothetical protein
VKKCHELGGDQEWNHRLSNDDIDANSNTITAIYNMAAGLCLGLNSDLEAGITDGEKVLTMQVCDNKDSHIWNLQSVPDSEL